MIISAYQSSVCFFTLVYVCRSVCVCVCVCQYVFVFGVLSLCCRVKILSIVFCFVL